MIKFSCEKVFLQNAIAVTSRAVAQKSSIPALEGLLIQQLTISGYNMQTGIRTNVFANVVEGGDIVLNARLFGDIIRRMPDDMITFTADEKMMVHVSCGDADFDILGLSAADYPDLPEVEDEYAVSMQQKVLRSMIEEVAFAVSTNESRPVHTGALFEIADMSLSMVAVDRQKCSGKPSCCGRSWKSWRAARFPSSVPAPPSVRSRVFAEIRRIW